MIGDETVPLSSSLKSSLNFYTWLLISIMSFLSIVIFTFIPIYSWLFPYVGFVFLNSFLYFGCCTTDSLWQETLAVPCEGWIADRKPFLAINQSFMSKFKIRKSPQRLLNSQDLKSEPAIGWGNTLMLSVWLRSASTW